MIHFVTWLWGDKYSWQYVNRLFAGIQRHLPKTLRPLSVDFLAIHDEENSKRAYGAADGSYWLARMPPEAEALTREKGCFARLVMFSPAWQRNNGIMGGDYLCCIDLDAVVTGDVLPALTPLVDGKAPFAILQGANAANPCPYNGSVMLIRASAHPEAWDDFSMDAARAAPFYEYPDDQGWLAYKIPNAAGWRAGDASGIYAFRKPGWPGGDNLPSNARLVVFPGARDPSKLLHLPWIRENWL